MDSLTSYQYITCIDQLARTPFFSATRPNAPRHLINVTLGLRGFGRVVQERRHGRALNAAAARAATPEASLARAPARDHAHRRGLLYLRRASPGFPTGRPCVPARIACSGRRLEEPESSFDLRGVAYVIRGEDTGRRQVWSHRAPGLAPIADCEVESQSPRHPCPLNPSSTARAHVGCSTRVWAR